MPENQEEPSVAPQPELPRNAIDVSTQVFTEPKPAETFNMGVRSVNISLREGVVEVTMLSDRSPPHARYIAIRNGVSRVVDDIEGSRIVETSGGFDDIAPDVREFLATVLRSAKKHGLA